MELPWLFACLFVLIGASSIGLGWMLRNHQLSEARMAGAGLMIIGAVEIVGSPWWADILVGAFR
jgi:hypothetical protein